MKVAFAIPTFNRAEKISKCIDSIIEFSHQIQDIEIEIIVCNNQSTDGTAILLENYKKKHTNFSFYTRKIFEKTGHESILKLLEELPTKYNWYWLMGDDDYIKIENSALFKSVLSIPNVDYIHASTPQKKYSDDLLLGPGIELSKKYGLIGLYGFISSQIISSSALDEIKIILSNYNLEKTYCFSHALLLHQVLQSKGGIIVSDGWVRNIDDTPSDGSGDPWLETAKFFREAHVHGVLNLPIDSGFLMSEGKFLWRNFICWMIIYSFKTKSSIDESRIKLINDTIQLCSDINLVASEKLIFNIICEELRYLHDTKYQDEKIKNSIIGNLTNIYNQLNNPVL